MALNPQITNWQGKRVWLIGASTGIGAALATQLAAAGARLVLSARNAERLNAFAADLPAAYALAFDVSVPSAWPVVAQDAATVYGGLDVVIFNAGTYTPQFAASLPHEGARAVFETNVLSVYNGLSAVLPGLLAQGQGHLVLVASVAGYGGLPKALSYGPSKAALNHLAQCLYLELAPLGLGVTVVNPGFVATPLTAQNTFHMPALMTAEAAAQRILRGLAKGVFEIHFPRRFSGFLKLLQYLPWSLYFPLVAKVTKE